LKYELENGEIVDNPNKYLGKGPFERLRQRLKGQIHKRIIPLAGFKYKQKNGDTLYLREANPGKGDLRFYDSHNNRITLATIDQGIKSAERSKKFKESFAESVAKQRTQQLRSDVSHSETVLDERSGYDQLLSLDRFGQTIERSIDSTKITIMRDPDPAKNTYQVYTSPHHGEGFLNPNTTREEVSLVKALDIFNTTQPFVKEKFIYRFR
jgi:hypothetical protein